MTEVWASIPGYEGSYEASSEGRIRSLDRVNSVGSQLRGRVLSPGMNNGRPTVLLCHAGVQSTFQVGVLVLTAFVGPRPDGMECCHWNDDATDNRVENLRWDTRSANALDRVRNGNHNNARKTHCRRGHAYSPENTYHHPSGSRICRECTRIGKRVRTESAA